MGAATAVRPGAAPRMIAYALLALSACPHSRDAGPLDPDSEDPSERDPTPAAPSRTHDAAPSSPTDGAAATDKEAAPTSAADASGAQDAGAGGAVHDAAAHDAAAHDAEAPPQDARTPTTDLQPNPPDASVTKCTGQYVFPCFDGVPDRTGLGSLSVSTLPRPMCPEEPPLHASDCTMPGLRCGYGSRARVDCRKLLECGFAWVDKSPTCYLPPPSHCPAARPEQGSPCDTNLLPALLPVCEYGAVTCTCGQRYFRDGSPGWQCNLPPTQPGCPQVAPNEGEGCAVQGLDCLYGPACQPGGGHRVCRDGSWAFIGQHDVCGQD
jgi:hypothetical protein